MKRRPNYPVWWTGSERKTVHHRQGGQASGEGHGARNAHWQAGAKTRLSRRSVPRSSGLRHHAPRGDRTHVRWRKVKLLLDTHLLLWLATKPKRPPTSARVQIENPENELLF